MQWPDRSPDLTAPDFFLWGYLMEKKVFITSSQNLEQERIRDAIREVQPETLQRVGLMNNVQSRLQQCVQNDGAHLIDVLFKK